MLHIIGLILRILGILLLGIIGLLLLFLFILLFVPVRYELKAEFPGELSSAKVRFRLTWLLHFLSARVYYEEQEFAWWLRVAWKKFPKIEEPDKETEEEPDIKKEPDAKQEPDEKETTDIKGISEKTEVSKKSTKIPQTEVAEKTCKESSKEIPEDSSIKWTERENQENRKKEKKPSVYERLKRKIITIWQKIKYTFAKICGKIKDISKNISDTKEAIQIFLNDEVHRSAFRKVKKELIWIKRLLKPKIFQVRLNYGFEDPCLTGQILGLLGMAYPFVGDNMEIEPDFEQKVLKGNIHIKGRIRMIHLAVFAVKLFVHKETRKTIMEVIHMVMK